MRSLLLAGSTLLALPAAAHHADYRSDALVQVEVLVDGREAPLYAAPDGSGRLYLEARRGLGYDVVLRNRSSERIGVVLVVDGLNVVSGERAEAVSPRNRMYILDPWGETSVRGWRTSLAEVRRFTFVDEVTSYAARAGKANRKMGWIEVGVFRERQLWTSRAQPITPDQKRDREVAKSQGAPAATPPPGAAVPEARAESRDAQERLDSLGYSEGRPYPGTGWGESRYDPAQVVLFDPMPTPAQLTTVRYEYAPALRALGILPQPRWTRDRLQERERAEEAFAQPPSW